MQLLLIRCEIPSFPETPASVRCSRGRWELEVCDLGGNTSSQIETIMNFGQVTNRSTSNGRAKKPWSFQSGPPGPCEVSGSAHKVGLGWPGLSIPAS